MVSVLFPTAMKTKKNTHQDKRRHASELHMYAVNAVTELT